MMCTAFVTNQRLFLTLALIKNNIFMLNVILKILFVIFIDVFFLFYPPISSKPLYFNDF
jgi:hypothetical protein